MSIPKDKLNEIFSDPEFLKLDDSEKESLLSALDSTFKTEVKPEKKVAGLYEKDVLARKFIPQFTKGLEEGTPLGRRVIMGDIPRQVSEGMPQPQGFMGTAGRVMGKYAAPVAMSIGAGGLAEQAAGKFIPGLAGASLAPRVGRVAIGSAVGAQPFEYKGPAERLTATGVAAVGGPLVGEALRLAPAALETSKAVLKSSQMVNNVVTKAGRAIESIKTGFENQYDDLFKTIGNKYIPKSLTQNTASVIDSSLRKVSPESPFYKYLTNLKDRLSGINGPELHALKQEVFNKNLYGSHQAEAKAVYEALTDVLSDKKVYGEAYKDLTFNYKNFLTKEKNYIDDLIYDKEGGLTPLKLVSGKKLHPEQLKAFKRLSTRAGLDVDLSKEVLLAKRGERVKGLIPYYKKLSGLQD